MTLHRFTPATYGDAPDAPVYLLPERLTWRDKARMRGAEVSAGLRMPTSADFVRAVRAAIKEHQPSNAAELLATVTAFDAILSSPAPEPPATGGKETRTARKHREAESGRRAAIVAAFNEVLDRSSTVPRVAALLGDRAVYVEMIFPLRASHVLRGWENVATPFRRVGDVVPDDVLSALPDADLTAIGVLASGLMAA